MKTYNTYKNYDAKADKGCDCTLAGQCVCIG
jgi:hypothetical protein